MTIGVARTTKSLNRNQVLTATVRSGGRRGGKTSMMSSPGRPGSSLLRAKPVPAIRRVATPRMATAGATPMKRAAEPMMTAVRALHGVRTTSVEAMIRSRRELKIRVPMTAGTLQPAPAMRGTRARPCSPSRRIRLSLRKATALR